MTPPTRKMCSFSCRLQFFLVADVRFRLKFYPRLKRTQSLSRLREINRLYASETGVTSCVEMFKFFVWKFARFRALFLYKHDNRCKYELHPRIAKETGVNWANEPTFKFPFRTDQSKHNNVTWFFVCIMDKFCLFSQRCAKNANYVLENLSQSVNS